MDFGVVGLNSLACSNSVSNSNNVFASENGAECNKHKWRGSEFLKQRANEEEDDFRELKKVAKISSFGDTMLKHRSNSEAHQQMLSFSNPSSQTVALPYFHSTSSGFGRNTGMHGVRGPFTPSQWMELEHQALIYKYIIASVPIPSYLLNPIRKALESAGFSGLRHNALGWSGFHLGFSNTDPEPGRCRRTDGKKWRCSRDAVPDQKYCERHLNRGRHRSRKPVEGHSASGITTSTAKLPPVASSKLPSAGSDSKNIGFSRQQLNNLQRGPSDTLFGLPNTNRSLSEKPNSDQEYQHTTFLHGTSPKVSQEFGLVCSDSLLNPLDRSSSLVNCRNYTTSDNPSDNGNKSHQPLRQFMDDWPKNQERSTISWPDVDLQPERTHLSISIPIETSDFMSSTTSPTGEQLTISPLGMTSTNTNNQGQRQTSWIPISWEPSMGGPLGEVLHTTSNGTGECNTARALNLIDRWDNSPRLASSPTGVLQRCAFGSLSNSSAGSSPRAESSKTLDGGSFYNGINGSGVMHPSLPAL